MVVLHGTFHHRVLGFNHNGAHRDSAGVVNARIVHSDSKETSRSEGFDLRIDLLEVPPDGLFPVVDAEEYLGRQSLG
jgi:hypothetical protein